MKSFVIFALIPLILSIGIISVTPLVDALQEKDVDTECREGQVLVFRINSNNYVCVSESTAQKWIDWGIAEQVEQAEEPAMAEEEKFQVCTMEWDPVCGVDGKTYGNMCMLNAAEVELEHTGECETFSQGIFPSALIYTEQAPEINPEKGYFVTEIADGLYWLIDGGYQMMFLTTGQGVIVVDAPEGMGEKILQAISDVTDEPITHVIYSHIHKDHIGSSHLYPDNAIYIAHSDAARHLEMKNDPDRPIPTESFDETYTLSVGNQVLELSYEGAFHSKGDIVILAPRQKVAMAVDLFHPGAGPFLGFGITTDMNAHLAIHDILIEKYDYDVLVPAHEQILATKDHLKTNKQFVLDVKENVIQAQQMVNYMEFAQQYGSQGQYAIYANYFDAVTEKCAELTLEEWQDQLRELEPFMKDHCRVMSFYVSID